MRPDAIVKLDKEIWEYYERNRQSDEVLQQKLKVLDELRCIAHQAFGGLRFVDICMCGSSVNGCGTMSSDLNLCLFVNDGSCEDYDDDDSETEKLKMVLEHLEKIEAERSERVFLGVTLITDRIPIIRFRTRSFSVDICCIEGEVAHRTALLIYNYSQMDKRFPAFAVYVNNWAAQVGIKGYSCLSSYAVTLMIVHYLQCEVVPPVLPRMILPQHTPVNQMSIGELLLGFFQYFSTFDFENKGIPFARGITERPADLELAFFIEEPCLSQYPVLCVRAKTDLQRVEEAFRNEAQRLTDYLNSEQQADDMSSIPPHRSESNKISPRRPLTPIQEEPEALSIVDIADVYSPDISPVIRRKPTKVPLQAQAAVSKKRRPTAIIRPLPQAKIATAPLEPSTKTAKEQVKRPAPSIPARRSLKKNDPTAVVTATNKIALSKSWFLFALSLAISVLILVLAITVALFLGSTQNVEVQQRSSPVAALPQKFYGKFELDSYFYEFSWKPSFYFSIFWKSSPENPLPSELEFIRTPGDDMMFDLRTKGTSGGDLLRKSLVALAEPTTHSEISNAGFYIADGVLKEKSNGNEEPKVYTYELVDGWLSVGVKKNGLTAWAYYRRA